MGLLLTSCLRNWRITKDFNVQQHADFLRCLMSPPETGNRLHLFILGDEIIKQIETSSLCVTENFGKFLAA